MGKTRSNQVALLLLVATLIMGVVAFYYNDRKAPPEEPIRVVYENKGGLVVFDHALHDTRMDGDCTVCHHSGDEESCKVCHEENDVPIMDAYHEKGEDFRDDDSYQSCMSCHKEEGMNPKNCRGCHL